MILLLKEQLASCDNKLRAEKLKSETLTARVKLLDAQVTSLIASNMIGSVSLPPFHPILPSPSPPPPPLPPPPSTLLFPLAPLNGESSLCCKSSFHDTTSSCLASAVKDSLNNRIVILESILKSQSQAFLHLCL